MIIVLSASATKKQIDEVADQLKEWGYEIHPIYGVEKTVIGAVGAPDADKTYAKEHLEQLPFVEQVVLILQPYKMVSRSYKPEGTVIDVGGVKIGGNEIVVMAGPCTVESYDQLLDTAKAIKKAGATILRGGAYKPCTSPYSFQGLGKEGLEMLAAAGKETGLKIITEVMDPRNVEMVAEYTDILQIGTRNMQNYDLLKEVGSSQTPVMLKRGMSAKIEEWLYAAEYIILRGNQNVMFCERGIRSFETYTRNTLDLSAVPAIKQLSHLPIIVDPSHGTGRWGMVAPMSKAAIACGADGLIIEVHPDPSHAAKDGAQSLNFDNFEQLMTELKPIATAVGKCIGKA
ncbi:MAG: 3-deoxy-7-phosphoheptulonate synthase [bacterium]